MNKKFDDALDAEPTQPLDDDTLADEATPDEAEPDLTPESFDLVAWLGGIGPAIAEYPLPGGGRIPMRARTDDWRQQWAQDTKDMSTEERDRVFVAAHIADERVTADALEGLQSHSPADWADIVGLAIHLDTRPRNQLAPRFLPGASG